MHKCILRAQRGVSPLILRYPCSLPILSGKLVFLSHLMEIWASKLNIILLISLCQIFSHWNSHSILRHLPESLIYTLCLEFIAKQVKSWIPKCIMDKIREVSKGLVLRVWGWNMERMSSPSLTIFEMVTSLARYDELWSGGCLVRLT